MDESRVLVIDDDPGLRLLLGTTLGSAGYDVRTVGDAATMRAALAEWTPDLLLLDIMLPDADGVQLLQELKANEAWRDVPVLMISARTPDEMTELALGLGAVLPGNHGIPGVIEQRQYCFLSQHTLIGSARRGSY